jgi:hypothetical protein
MVEEFISNEIKQSSHLPLCLRTNQRIIFSILITLGVGGIVCD